MKKLIYTLSFITLVGFAANAQSHADHKQDPKKSTAAPSTTPVPADQNTNMSAPPADNGQSRMAITQKGLPAAKAKDNNKDTKDKATEPKGQPAANDKH